MNEIEGPSLEVKYNALNKESVHIHAFNMFISIRKRSLKVYPKAWVGEKYDIRNRLGG